MRRRIALALLAAAAMPAYADEPPAFVARPGLEWTATVAGGALWLTTGSLIKPSIAPLDCRWCDTNGFDDWASALRRDDPHAVDLTSDIISYAVEPAAASGLVVLAAVQDHHPRDLSVDLLLVGESLVGAALVGEALRFATARERPFVHDLPAEDKGSTAHPEENNLSFVSGHAATSWALAIASGEVASRRHRRLAPVVWATGLTMATATSFFRVGSGEHYASDVLGGAALGIAVGLAVPYLHRARAGDRAVAASLAPVPGGGLVLVTFAEQR